LPRKKSPAAPKQTLRKPEVVGKAAFIESMRRLLMNDDFINLKTFWMQERFDILEKGKSKPSEAQWNVLRGYDKAVMAPEIYAAHEDGAGRDKQSGRRTE
jgi:hypothetical protein